MDTRDYKGIENIRDTYPTEPDIVSDSYTSNGNQIKLTGKFPQNFINFDIVDLSEINVPDVQIAPNVSFRFIVRFKNDTIGQGVTVQEWTSKNFLDDLKKAQQENNPYFTKKNITIATVDFGYLTKYSERSEFRIPELYANVTVTDTITTKEDMLQHINWMVSGQENLRPVRDFGNWTVSLTDTLGLEYSDQIEALNRGETITNTEADNSNIDINIPDEENRSNADPNLVRTDRSGGSRSTTNITDSTATVRSTSEPRSNTTTTAIRTRTSSVNTNYSPFNTAGRYTGETRFSSTNGLYIWADGRWNPM